jgi:hypothetical protein
MVTAGAQAPQLLLGIPDAALVSPHHLLPVLDRMKQDRAGRHETGVEVRVAVEAMTSKEARPVIGRAHVEVGGLLDVRRGGREEHRPAMAAEVGDRGGRLLGADVLQDLDAGYEVIVAE